MRFAYHLWQPEHFENFPEILETLDCCDYFILNLWAMIPDDITPSPMVIEPNHSADEIGEMIDLAHQAGKQVVLRILPTPRHSRGKTPKWWQGYIGSTWKTSEWGTFFFREFFRVSYPYMRVARKKQIHSIIFGGELSQSLKEKQLWSLFIRIARLFGVSDVSYSHHWSQPLMLYHSTIFEYLIKNKGYGGALKLMLDYTANPFQIPEGELEQIGKNLWESGPLHPSISNFSYGYLADYWWLTLDKEYSEEQLEKQWELYAFIPAVRKWKTATGKHLWLENAVGVAVDAGIQPSEECFLRWWRVYLRTHRKLGDVVSYWSGYKPKDWHLWRKVIRGD